MSIVGRPLRHITLLLVVMAAAVALVLAHAGMADHVVADSTGHLAATAMKDVHDCGSCGDPQATQADICGGVIPDGLAEPADAALVSSSRWLRSAELEKSEPYVSEVSLVLLSVSRT